MSPKIISSLFLALIFGLPLGQAAWEVWKGESVQVLEIVGPVNETRLRAFEDDLRQASFMHQEVTPWYQLLLFSAFGRGNEKSIPGNDGELYFGENLDYVTQPAFGRSGEAAIRSTIEDFARQLDAQGIDLVLVPAPAKAAVKPYHLSLWSLPQDNAERADTRNLLSTLKGVHVWDKWDAGPSGTGVGFMPRDTHWTPAAMRDAAKRVAELGRTVLERRGVSLERRKEWVAEPYTHFGEGDLAELLRLPESV
ncbi:MAG: hypothetical protein P8N31_03170, partial [Planctomycetota bacterium]|nr:hypothetical protein [Planctomycetota bacterium]